MFPYNPCFHYLMLLSSNFITFLENPPQIILPLANTQPESCIHFFFFPTSFNITGKFCSGNRPWMVPTAAECPRLAHTAPSRSKWCGSRQSTVIAARCTGPCCCSRMAPVTTSLQVGTKECKVQGLFCSQNGEGKCPSVPILPISWLAGWEGLSVSTAAFWQLPTADWQPAPSLGRWGSKLWINGIPGRWGGPRRSPTEKLASHQAGIHTLLNFSENLTGRNELLSVTQDPGWKQRKKVFIENDSFASVQET